MLIFLDLIFISIVNTFVMKDETNKNRINLPPHFQRHYQSIRDGNQPGPM